MAEKPPPFTYERPKERFIPPETLPNRMEVPDKTILAIPHSTQFIDSHEKVVAPLKTHKKRDWFVQHAYFCLPLTFGNQHGFGIRAMSDFRAIWNGGNEPKDVVIEQAGDSPDRDLQYVSSHFGMGVITVQNRFSLRTPKGINLIVMDPPNYMMDGVHNMFAVVETDNLRRDFTFNLRITRPDHWIEFTAGQIISCFMPYPRGFIDGFEVKSAYACCPSEIVEEEMRTSDYFAIERSQIDTKYAGQNGGRYMAGEDIYSMPFEEHQKKLD